MDASDGWEICRHAELTVVSLGPDYVLIDWPAARRLEPVLKALADSVDPPRLVIDLPHTQAFGSAFLMVMVRTWERLRTRGSVHFGLSSASPYCSDILRTSKMDTLWRLFPSREAAIKHWSGAG